MFLFWCWSPCFFHFNVLISCQRQFSGFWHRHTQTLSHYSFISTLFSLLVSPRAILTCLSPTATLPLSSPPLVSQGGKDAQTSLMTDLFPADLSCTPCLSSRWQTVVCPIRPYSTPQCLPHTLFSTKHTRSPQIRRHLIPINFIKEIAGNKYERTGAAAGNCMNYHVDMQMHLGTLFVFVRGEQIFSDRNVNFC